MITNSTDNCSAETYFGIYIVYITGLISLITVCECLIVIIVVLCTKKFDGNTHIFVASLAVNDLILAVVFFFNQVTVVPRFWSDSFKRNMKLSIIFGIAGGATNISLMHMAIIALDRYIKIVYPFFYTKNVTMKRSLIILLCVWILGLCNMIVPAVIYTDKNTNNVNCVLMHIPIDSHYFGIVVYFSMIIIIFICYLKIALVAFKHKKAANERGIPTNDTTGEILVRKNRMAAMRSVKFFAIMFGVFSLCSCPPHLANMIDQVYPLSGNITVGLFFLTPINSIINFLIYVNMNNEFSKELKKMVSNLIERCCKRTNQM